LCEQVEQRRRLLESRFGTRPAFGSHVGAARYRLAVGRVISLHPHLHACVVADQGRHELVAGGIDHLSGEPDCADPDCAERARGNQVWDSFSGSLPVIFWPAGCECPGLVTGIGGMRLVWNPMLDWRLRRVDSQHR
jgi:hypothetical protein